ncbi:GMP synthase-like glutamine amidotransferase [Methylohalomonas lacus]|uniref:GMP synthase-like glutamine amidotransferase n=1 Tax=Methylohalomonas lacus TaxID=398773 RepID=A0AAE3HM59_9GAMM|nr:type 1 glutamine amidotransferase [Methylohalomonas lacus]MCS3903843.1 GMP synthase-like glutamine amidotransferase [Methylohalomonas lacus]
MKPIHIVRHEDWIKAGHLTDTLDSRGIPYTFTAIDQHDPVPKTVEGISGLALLGCTYSVNDGHGWANEEINLIKQALDADIPVLGHCFGSQLMSKAMGGEIYPMSAKEIGWHEVECIHSPEADKWLGDDDDEFEILIWHHDAFTIPPGATPLYKSDFCPDQAFVYGDNVATVAHLEVTAKLLEDWLEIYGYDLDPISETVQSPEEVRRDMHSRITNMHKLTDRLYDHWLQGVQKRL